MARDEKGSGDRGDKNSQCFNHSPWSEHPATQRASPALDQVPSHGGKGHQLSLEESTCVARRAVFG